MSKLPYQGTNGIMLRLRDWESAIARVDTS